MHICANQLVIENPEHQHPQLEKQNVFVVILAMHVVKHKGFKLVILTSCLIHPEGQIRVLVCKTGTHWLHTLAVTPIGIGVEVPL